MADNDFLIADVGGTNIRLGIANKEYKNYSFLQTYKCAKFSGIAEVIKLYLANLDAKIKPQKGVIAVAAAVASDKIIMTNNNWEFSIKELTKDIGFKKLKVINDFEAQGYAVEHLEEADLSTIIKAKVKATNGRRVILGPGTGMGTAFLQYNNKWNIISSECGHIVIGSYNHLEQEIFNYIRKTKNLEPYAEAFLSGPGMVNIYRGLCAINNKAVDETVASKHIVEKANNKDADPIYLETLSVFCNILGTYVANTALIYLPYDGIYLTGGILPRIIEYLKNGNFASRYQDRALPTVLDILDSIDVKLIIKENPAMLGLAKSAIDPTFFD